MISMMMNLTHTSLSGTHTLSSRGVVANAQDSERAG